MSRKKNSQSRNNQQDKRQDYEEKTQRSSRGFKLEFKNASQKLAYSAFDQHDVLFLLGAAGTGKSFLAMAFAISEILAKKRKRIIISRPVVEAGEKLGFLPGSLEEKLDPYMLPLFDHMTKLLGPKEGNPEREKIDRITEIAPIAYLRGRSQPLESLVMTPNGPKPMGEMQVGDVVFNSKGSTSKVRELFPQGKIKVYKLLFNDGTSAECSEDHLWETMTLSEKRHNKGYTVKSTKEIMKKIKTNYGQKNHRFNLTKPVEWTCGKLEFNPYIIGCLLGDGNFHEKASITLTNVDKELLANIIDLLPSSLSLKKTSGISYRISTGKTSGKNPLRKYLLESNLLGKKSYEKLIPKEYIYSSIEDRISLLQGLLDTDGCVWMDKKTCRVQYYSTSIELAKQIQFIVRSLGGVALLRERNHDKDKGHYSNGKLIQHRRNSYVLEISNLDFNPFRISRKANAYQKRSFSKLLCDIEYVGEKYCQCISLDSDDGLYLTNDFVVTHNTFDDSICILDEAQNCTFMQMKLFLTRFGENSKVIITGDPHQSDLFNGQSALMDVVRRLSPQPGIGVINFGNDCIVRHPLIEKIIERLEA